MIKSQCQLEGSLMTHHICGKLESPDHTRTNEMQWLIQGLSGYNSVLKFEEFKIIYSKDCQINSLNLNKQRVKLESYCGHLPNWTETCPCDVIEVLLNVTSWHFNTSFKMSYMTSKKRAMSIHMIYGAFQPSFISYLVWKFEKMPGLPQLLTLDIYTAERIHLIKFHRPQMGYSASDLINQPGEWNSVWGRDDLFSPVLPCLCIHH